MKIIYSKKYLDYNFGPDHPFWPQRAGIFLKKLKKSKISHEILTPQRATDKDIFLVHSEEYLKKVKKLAKQRSSLSIDTPLNPNVLEAAFWSVGGSILALNLATQGEKAINLLGGFHHAGISTGSGFCVFNDHSIAIRKFQKEGKIKKAIIYDLDVHAGQGTQEIFYFDPTVFTISIHQDPTTLYPGTGFSWQKGEGRGKRYNLNIPLPPGIEEKEYLSVLDSVLPKAKIFNPDVVVLVLGVDTYKKDPLANFKLEETTYMKIGEKFKKFSKLAVMFAGGYSKETPRLWLNFLKGLEGN